MSRHIAQFSLLAFGLALGGCQTTSSTTSTTTTTKPSTITSGGTTTIISGTGTTGTGTTGTGGTGTGTTTSTGTTTGTTGTSTGSTSSVPTAPKPGYLTKGFSFSKGQAGTDLRVEAYNSNTGAASVLSQAPSSVTVRFQPQTRQMSVLTTGKAYDGTVDSEAVVYSNGGRSGGTTYVFNDSDGTGNGLNQAVLNVGDWAYAGHAQYDQDDGPYSHALSFYGGWVPAKPPTTGNGTYATNHSGSIYVLKKSGGFRTIPVKGSGVTEVCFDCGTYKTSHNVFDAKTNAALGSFTGNGRIEGAKLKETTVSGGIKVEGRTRNFGKTNVLGTIAGPNGQEVSGIYRIGIDKTSSLPAATINGAFQGKDNLRN